MAGLDGGEARLHDDRWRLDAFGVDELESASAVLRTAGAHEGTMLEAAERVVGLLHDGLVVAGGAPACPLVRLYLTRRLDKLDQARQDFARARSFGVQPEHRCLTLLASRGALPDWNDPLRSTGHLAIPLGSAAAIASLPMVSSMFEQLGVSPGEVLGSDQGDRLRVHHRDFEVFHVPDAAASPMIPDQAFVADHGIASVVGLGGGLPSGDLFAVVLFSSVPIDARTAELMRPLGVAVKAALVPSTFRVFAAG